MVGLPNKRRESVQAMEASFYWPGRGKGAVWNREERGGERDEKCEIRRGEFLI